VVLFNCMNSHRQSNKEKKGESSKRILKKEKRKRKRWRPSLGVAFYTAF